MAAHPNATDLYFRRAVCCLRVRQWSKALGDFRRVVDSQPQFPWNWYHWGLLSLHQGDIQEYQRACREVVARSAKSADNGERHAMVHLVFLGASSGLDAHQLLELEAANRGKTTNDDWVRLALYRRGRFEEASETKFETSFGAVGAMAEYRLGNESRAKALLAEARQAIQSKRDPKTMFWPVVGTAPWSIMEPEILIREAEQLIAPNEKPTVPVPPK